MSSFRNSISISASGRREPYTFAASPPVIWKGILCFRNKRMIHVSACRVWGFIDGRFTFFRFLRVAKKWQSTGDSSTSHESYIAQYLSVYKHLYSVLPKSL